MIRRRVAPVLLALACALVVADPTLGQVLARGVFANGVGSPSGGGFVLRGALGQPFTGGVGGPANKACAGFWCVLGFGVVDGTLPPDAEAEVLTFALGPAVPNPTRGNARLELTLPTAGRVRLEAFDVSGRRAGDPLEQAFEAGRYRLAWDGARAGAGVYFVRLTVDGVLRGERRVVVVR